MWRLMLLAYFTTMVYSQQQNSRRPEHDNGHGWDIRLAVPGRPGTDYPTLNSIPRTTFTCSGKSPGYYADVEAGCQVFRVCTLGSTYGFQSFLCPNGTLFNQEVFVCDWWMSARCEKTRQILNENNDKFGNLKLGPQLMKDIKKMLTHPLRNPYDKTIMKSNVIVMQDYKPPSGQLFPNGALISGPERLPSNVYVPAKQRQGNYVQNSFHSSDLAFAASTPSSQYIPSASNVIRPAAPRDVEVLRPQIQNLNLIQKSFSGTVPHSGTEHLASIYNNDNNSNRIGQLSVTQQQNLNQRNKPTSQHIQSHQSQRQLSQYNTVPNNQLKKQQELTITNTNKHHTNIAQQNRQALQKNIVPQFPRAISGYVDRGAKQNLVSSNIIPPVGKTLKFSRIVQKSSTGNPKSRITFKTWIVRPPKSARLIVEPTPYTYNRPINAPIGNMRVDTTTPTTDKENSESEDVPYVYDRPMPSSKQIRTTDDSSLIYLPPTEPTLFNRLYSTSKVPQNSKQSGLYLAATTYKPSSRLYVPPSEDTLGLSRQYLSPNLRLPQTDDYQSARLVATPTSSTFDFTTALSNTKTAPSFSLHKQSHINTNRNNLTFSDILTKEKLDITVNDIIKDTNNLLKSESQSNTVAETSTANNLCSEFGTDDSRQFRAQPQRINCKSEKILLSPSTDLEPPSDTSVYNAEYSNKFSKLPFFKEPAVPTNTIERTVSLKITIPETIADYLFNNNSENDVDNLEILNTGSSNYLVLTNNRLEENNGAGLIPIGKLIWDKNINISNSQALVYSFLTDSINAAREYSNIAKQNVIPTIPTQPQFLNLNNENLEDITNKVSQFTSSQFSNDNQNSANFVQLPQKTRSSAYYRDNTKYTTDNLHLPGVQNHQVSSQFSQKSSPEQLYSSQLQRYNSQNLIESHQGNSNQLYSGQLYKLPVPEVTRQLNNFHNSIQSSNARLTDEIAPKFSQRDVDQGLNGNSIPKQSNNNIEIMQTLLYPQTRQELPRTEEATFNTPHNSENIFADKFLSSDTGITAQVQDKIVGTLPHPLEENKLVTYKKNKSYYLYTKLEDNTNDDPTNTIDQSSQNVNQQNAKYTHNNNMANRVTFELLPSIGYELGDENEKQQILNALKINDFKDSHHNGKTQSLNHQFDNLVSGVDYTIIHPLSKKQVEPVNNINTILYRGPSSYLAPQSTVGSLGANQQIKSDINSRIEKFDDNNNNGYAKISPARQFSF